MTTLSHLSTKINILKQASSVIEEISMRFEYLAVYYDHEKNWAKIGLRPSSFDKQLRENVGLDWIGEKGWELVSSTLVKDGEAMHYLIFKKAHE